MPLVVKDRVRETSTTAGTGTFTLAGAVLGYQSFSAVGNGNTTYYTIYLQGGNEWEVGIGTYTASGTTLSRDTILASSNGGSAVNFSAGVKDVFVTYPAGRSVYYDTATNVTLNALTLSGGTANGVLYLNGSKVATSGSALTFDGSTFLTSVGSNLTTRIKQLALDNYTNDGVGITFPRTSDGAEVMAFGVADVDKLGLFSRSGLIFATAGGGLYSAVTEKMRITETGQVNIGGNFTSTNNTLQVTGNAAIGYTAAAPSNGLIVAGNVGIGTDSPITKLSNTSTAWAGGSATDGLVWRSTQNDWAASILATPASGAGYGLRLHTLGTTASDYPLFITSGAGAGSNVMIVTGAGNLGIGTNNPAAKLDVLGPTSDQIRVRTAATEFYRFGRNASTGFLDFYGSQTGYQGYTFGGVDGTWVTINSSGNLGLGVTPSAWISNRRALEIGGKAANILGFPDIGQLYYNLYLNSSAEFVYKTTGYAGTFDYNYAVPGGFAWNLAASGTANTTTVTSGKNYTIVSAGGTNYTSFGAANNNVGTSFIATSSGTGNGGSVSEIVAYTQAMTLNSSGNLGIGITNPTAKLDIAAGAGAAVNAIRVRSLSTNSNGFNIVTDSVTDNIYLNNFYNAAMLFGTNNTERMRIDSAGTVFIRDGASTTNTNSSRLVVGGTISETVSSTQYLVASQYDIGTAANEIPLNQYLGNLAYQDAGSIAGQVGLSAGTAALPSLVSATDTDTGMWFPAANTLAWSTGGTERARITSGGDFVVGGTAAIASTPSRGNVTINGTSTAIMALSIGGAAKAAIYHNNSNVEIINYQSGGDLDFYVNGAYRARISSDGTFRVKGAGTVGSTDAIQFSGLAPANSLIVNNAGLLFFGGVTAQKAGEVARIGYTGLQSSILIDNAANTNGAFVGSFNDAALVGVNRNPSTGNFYDTSKYAADIFIVGSTTTSYIGFETSNAANTLPTERMRITATGEIGIGESNPASYGQVVIRKDTASGAGSSGASCLWFLNANTTANNASSIFFGDNATTAAGGINFINTDHTNEYGVITFDTRGSGGYGERARITSGGDILFVGSSAAFAKSTTPCGQLYYDSANGYVYLSASSNTGYGTIYFNVTNAGTNSTALSLNYDGKVSANGVYAATVGATNRDVYVDNTGLIGYVSSTRASKTNINDLLDTSWLLQLKPVTFNYRKKDDQGQYTEQPDGVTEYGLIAEDTETVNPDLCFYDLVDGQKELRGISYSKLIAPMLKMLQEQQEMINELKAEVTALKGA